ncbi:MAG: hypothetical protein GX201_02695 [Clostridiales bacterium]|nr:hypothetical protein [Clostridiales bacterium]
MNEILKYLYYRIMGYVYVPELIKNIDEKKLVHISDTPVIFFEAVKKLLKDLSPNVIIHTGDMVDNIKLSVNKHQLPRYENHLQRIIQILESSSAEDIYMCVGNHDNYELMHKFAKRSIIVKYSTCVNIFNTKATISHYPLEIIKNPSDYNFFGHDISLGNDMVNNRVYLNGVLSINILTSETKKLFHLPYPISTNDARLLKGKIGL